MKFKRNNNTEIYVKAGDWKLYLKIRKLSNGVENDLLLESRLFSILYALLKQPNKVVSNEELIYRVWENTDANVDSLKEAITNLRNELNLHFENPPKIIQVKNNGYRLLVTTTLKKDIPWKFVFKYILYFLVIFIVIIFTMISLQ